jgi:flagellar FliJ protein
MEASTLLLLIARAKTACDAAQGRFAAARRQQEQARAHLQVLREYAGEYTLRARSRPGDRRDPSAERNQEVFLGRLDVAVQAQERELAAREKTAQAAAAEMALALRRHKSLETLLRRRQEQAQRAQARRDQKQTDEFAQRARGDSDADHPQHDAITAGNAS